MKLRLFILFVLIFSVVLTSVVEAATPSSIGVNLAPPNPAPFENVTITLNSFANNLDTVTISWFVNEKPALSAVGQKSFSLTAPAAGVEALVRARIDLPEGALNIRVSIRPNPMTLLWQATDSYVPPFYKGKAMPTLDSEIKIVAMPEIKNVSPKSLAYSWRKNYSNDQNASGYGKNFYTYISDYLENASSVSVVASTVDGSSSSEASILVNTVEPEISFYRVDENLGTIWEEALGEGYRITGEGTIVAEPYFISPNVLGHPSLIWNWFINNTRVTSQSFRPNLLPLRAQEGTSGVSRISLELENRDKLFQRATKTINVQF